MNRVTEGLFNVPIYVENDVLNLSPAEHISSLRTSLESLAHHKVQLAPIEAGADAICIIFFDALSNVRHPHLRQDVEPSH